MAMGGFSPWEMPSGSGRVSGWDEQLCASAIVPEVTQHLPLEVPPQPRPLWE